MISTKEVKIKIQKKFTNEYIDNTLKSMGYDVLHWAVTDFDDENYVLNISIVEE